MGVPSVWSLSPEVKAGAETNFQVVSPHSAAGCSKGKVGHRHTRRCGCPWPARLLSGVSFPDRFLPKAVPNFPPGSPCPNWKCSAPVSLPPLDQSFTLGPPPSRFLAATSPAFSLPSATSSPIPECGRVCFARHSAGLSGSPQEGFCWFCVLFHSAESVIADMVGPDWKRRWLYWVRRTKEQVKGRCCLVGGGGQSLACAESPSSSLVLSAIPTGIC